MTVYVKEDFIRNAPVNVAALMPHLESIISIVDSPWSFIAKCPANHAHAEGASGLWRADVFALDCAIDGFRRDNAEFIRTEGSAFGHYQCHWFGLLSEKKQRSLATDIIDSICPHNPANIKRGTGMMKPITQMKVDDLLEEQRKAGRLDEWHRIVSSGSAAEVGSLVQSINDRGDLIGLVGRFMSMAATFNPNPGVIKRLAGFGVENWRGCEDEATPLLLAAANNSNPAVMVTLLECGADPHHTCLANRTVPPGESPLSVLRCVNIVDLAEEYRMRCMMMPSKEGLPLGTFSAADAKVAIAREAFARIRKGVFSKR